MQDYNQHRKGRNLRKYCSDEGIDYKWLFDYKKSYGSCKPSAKDADSNSGFIPLQIIEERCGVSKSESVETSWCIKQLVLSTPLGDDIEIRSKNMAAVLELLRKMLSWYVELHEQNQILFKQRPC